eukprot:488957-Pelagomonas_calceolata.AAC.3
MSHHNYWGLCCGIRGGAGLIEPGSQIDSGVLGRCSRWDQHVAAVSPSSRWKGLNSAMSSLLGVRMKASRPASFKHYEVNQMNDPAILA